MKLQSCYDYYRSRFCSDAVTKDQQYRMLKQKSQKFATKGEPGFDLYKGCREPYRIAMKRKSLFNEPFEQWMRDAEAAGVILSFHTFGNERYVAEVNTRFISKQKHCVYFTVILDAGHNATYLEERYELMEEDPDLRQRCDEKKSVHAPLLTRTEQDDDLSRNLAASEPEPEKGPSNLTAGENEDIFTQQRSENRWKTYARAFDENDFAEWCVQNRDAVALVRWPYEHWIRHGKWSFAGKQDACLQTRNSWLRIQRTVLVDDNKCWRECDENFNRPSTTRFFHANPFYSATEAGYFHRNITFCPMWYAFAFWTHVTGIAIFCYAVCLASWFFPWTTAVVALVVTTAVVVSATEAGYFHRNITFCPMWYAFAFWTHVTGIAIFCYAVCLASWFFPWTTAVVALVVTTAVVALVVGIIAIFLFAPVK